MDMEADGRTMVLPVCHRFVCCPSLASLLWYSNILSRYVNLVLSSSEALCKAPKVIWRTWSAFMKEAVHERRQIGVFCYEHMLSIFMPTSDMGWPVGPGHFGVNGWLVTSDDLSRCPRHGLVSCTLIPLPTSIGSSVSKTSSHDLCET